MQLKHKLKIRSSNGPEVLLKVVKNPVTQHLPAGAVRIGTSVKGELVNINEFVKTLPQDQPVVYVFGSHAHGPCEVDYTEKSIAISSYPLAASVALARLCGAYEQLWNIL